MMAKVGEKSKLNKDKSRADSDKDVSLKKLADQTREDLARDQEQVEQSSKEAQDQKAGQVAKKQITIIPAEQRYVRRTKKQFSESAAPLSDASYRMKKLGVLAIPEIIDAVGQSSAHLGVDQAQWLRAAIRKALREGLDVDYELDTPIEFSVPTPPEAE
ncbi:hypothetical protein [Novosphingobium beihaiensis]|uniref:Uncharacterized protein n=1 Tax=Novosphingobium beihaiensis TaxID=2930389 RepID=A0ABT0BS79_9SPHN|nr:hypothetical protein [Novosphingobium beihaiensis]MCJ2187894.1 hypothetical protein [Novosphingobium beihaiensis]